VNPVTSINTNTINTLGSAGTVGNMIIPFNINQTSKSRNQNISFGHNGSSLTSLTEFEKKNQIATLQEANKKIQPTDLFMFQTKSRNINKPSELGTNNIMNSESSVGKNEPTNKKSRNIDKLIITDKSSSKTHTMESKTVASNTKEKTSGSKVLMKDNTTKPKKNNNEIISQAKFNKPTNKLLSEKSKLPHNYILGYNNNNKFNLNNKIFTTLNKESKPSSAITATSLLKNTANNIQITKMMNTVTTNPSNHIITNTNTNTNTNIGVCDSQSQSKPQQPQPQQPQQSQQPQLQHSTVATNIAKHPSTRNMIKQITESKTSFIDNITQTTTKGHISSNSPIKIISSLKNKNLKLSADKKKPVIINSVINDQKLLKQKEIASKINHSSTPLGNLQYVILK